MITITKHPSHDTHIVTVVFEGERLIQTEVTGDPYAFIAILREALDRGSIVEEVPFIR